MQIFLVQSFWKSEKIRKQQLINSRYNQNGASLNLSGWTFQMLPTNVHLFSHHTEDERRQIAFSSVLLTFYSSLILRSNSTPQALRHSCCW